MDIEDDPFLNRFFGSVEERAKWIYRFRVAYIIWIFFVVIGIMVLTLFYLLK